LYDGRSSRITITIDLALAREVAAHGRSVETHAAHVLEQAVQLPADRALDTITGGIEIDDSPVVVTSLAIDQGRYAVGRPLAFSVTFDSAEGVYTATGDFHMMVCAETRDELEHAVQQALIFLWHDYAMADPDTLSADAVALREQLIATFAASADAA
jgi:plasmid stability protein